nr:hypothetical protein [uncultured Cohaesibacter sp.]
MQQPTLGQQLAKAISQRIVIMWNKRSGAAKGGAGRPDARPDVFGVRTMEERATTGRETRGKKMAKGS